MIAYIDTSVLVRIVLGEPDPLPEWRAIQVMASSILTEVELGRVLDNRRMHHRLEPDELAAYRAAAQGIIGEMMIIELDRPLLRRAGEPFNAPLGTLDAIHLATALRFLLDEITSDERLVLATHDAALAVAARAHGLDVVGA